MTYPPPPPAYTSGGYGVPPANYLVWAILSTIFCCLPLGIASIVFSTQVNSKWAMGDVAGAQASSTKAKQFAIWAIVIGGILTILSTVVYFVLLAAGLATFNLNTTTTGF
jgi:hypothetical protein